MFKAFSRAPIHDPLASTTARTEVKTTTCYMCACRCGIRAHLVDGALRYIDGNPDHPINKGVICAKGSAGIMKQNSPARLTQPLLRRPGSDRGAVVLLRRGETSAEPVLPGRGLIGDPRSRRFGRGGLRLLELLPAAR